MKRLIIAFTVVAASAAGTGNAMADDRETTRISGFGLNDNASSALRYPGNANVFDGQVLSAAKPRHVVRKFHGKAVISYVYTPIRVRVLRVYKGRDVKPGQVVVVRALGGATRTHRTVSEFGPAPASFRRGMRLALFTQPMVDAGDGLRAVTPNFAYAYGPHGRQLHSLKSPYRLARTNTFRRALGQLR